MPSEPLIAELVRLGNDISSIKMYAISVTALWSYDYLLTLKDEVRYAWKTKNRFIFVLFLMTRYLPVPFLVWIVTSSWLPSYTAELTVFLEVIYFTSITLLAHIVLTLRVYAITGKNKWIAGALYGLSIIQFGVGLYLCVYTSLNHRSAIVRLPRIHLDAYQMCFFQIPRFGSLLYTSLSLAFDLGALLIVLGRTVRTQRYESNVPNILDTVTRDAVTYFSVIFSSHLVLVLMLVSVRPSLRFLPTVGNAVFVPMMITRIILSLKKAAGTPPKYEMADIPNRLPVVSPELQVTRELRHNPDHDVFPRTMEHIGPSSGSSSV
ncbi:hypothetical protein BDM02DRAFT_3131949 [Thelephora ganbajun]|uniref:Uncharacterized protein n=1 Tax=Thelephora ganbajun TaxID=370292 RepID=A0ACB6Z3Q3_THEGA|nr:hypothetical protein BDM02DRAFT_3131949 [Thelephora ganbajun]